MLSWLALVTSLKKEPENVDSDLGLMHVAASQAMNSEGKGTCLVPLIYIEVEDTPR